MNKRLPEGKIPPEMLKNIVFKNLGVSSPKVLLGPGIGEDAAVIELEHKVIVVATDPITGAIEDIGWLSVHINANDIACHGARPAWFLSTILLPENSDEKTLEKIVTQMDKAAKELEIAIVGGHTEVTPGLKRPIVAGFMIGEAEKDKFVTSSGALPGDKIILTKGVAIEGTAILATERGKEFSNLLDKDLIEKAKKYKWRISVVEDALTAVEVGGVTAMHDPTEGGVLGGLHEIADASKTGFAVQEEKIRKMISEETRKICELLQIDPLCLIGSGALLITAKPEKAQQIVEALNGKGIFAEIIGHILDNPKRRIFFRKDGKTKKAQRPAQDALWEALSKKLKD